MNWLIPFIVTALVSALIPLLFTLFWVKKSGGAIADTLTAFVEARDEALQTQLDPILKQNSRVMGIVGNMGNTQKQEKIALSHLGDDLLNQNELVLEALKGVAPGFAEYLQEHPDLVIKLAPRIEKLLESRGGIDGLLGGFGSPSLSGRSHPFRTEE